MKTLNLISIFFIYIILTSCASREQTFVSKNYGNSCNVVCKGETIFKHESGWPIDFPYHKTKRFSKNEFYFSGNEPCLGSQYIWDSIDQVEINKGLHICSAQIGRNHKFESVYHCGLYNNNKSEKINILNSLKLCEKEVVEYKANYRPSISLAQLQKQKKEKDLKERQVLATKRARETCISLGFNNQKDIADCGLKILTTQKQLNQSIASNDKSGALAKQIQLNNSIRLMQQGLQLMQPQINSVNCNWTLTGWTCF